MSLYPKWSEVLTDATPHIALQEAGRNNMGILTEMLVCEDMTSCTDLACHHVVDEIATFCHCSV